MKQKIFYWPYCEMKTKKNRSSFSFLALVQNYLEVFTWQGVIKFGSVNFFVKNCSLVKIVTMF